MNFDLPSTGAEQSPAFINASDCRKWLARVPLANLEQAQSILLRQLNLLHRYSLAPTERFAILEALRATVSEVQEGEARSFGGQPMPLDPRGQAALDITLGVWHMMAFGYLRCFTAICDDAQGDSAMRAACAQRTLTVFADWQVGLYRGGTLPDAEYWRKLHHVYAAAEAFGVAEQAVNDSLRNGNAPSSVQAAYAECSLLSAAGLNELPPRHLGWVAGWARRWGPKLAVLKAPPHDIRQRAVPLWVDLDSESPPGYAPQASHGGRWLETSELRNSLLARIDRLEKGRAPAELQLGDDVTQPAAGLLLQCVLQRWCKGGVPRRGERHAAAGGCALIVGFDAVHCRFSGGKSFRAPSRDDVTLRREREEFETFGDRRRSVARQGDEDQSSVENWQIMDDWQLLNESTAGLRIARPAKAGIRVGAGRLIAVRTGASEQFSLGSLRWALCAENDQVIAGIQRFPGDALAVAVRTVETGDVRGPWRQGFLLPEITASPEPASVVVPAGTFRRDRRIEAMVDHEIRVLKLFRLLEHGVEFERCNMYAYV